MTRELIRIVERGQKRRKAIILLRAMGIEIAVPLTYLWLMLWADNRFHFPGWGRLLAFACFAGLIAWLTRRSTRQWYLALFSQDQAALAIEHRTHGGLENRLINAIQLSRTPAVPFVDAVVRENYRAISSTSVNVSPGARPAIVPMVAALCLLLVGAWFWILKPDYFTNAAARILFPFADIQPIYQTVLTVEPGDVRALPDQDVVVRIGISGRIPDAVWILTDKNGEQASIRLPVASGAQTVTHTFESVRQPLRYAVRGGDYESRYFLIHVPIPFSLRRLAATLHYPSYMRIPARSIETTTGDLEAPAGTRASLRFHFSQSADSAGMRIQFPPPPEAPAAAPTLANSTIPMERVSPSEYKLDLVFENVAGYVLEAMVGSSNITIGPRSIRIIPDRPPDLQLTGLSVENELMADAVVPLNISVRDDYGLKEVGLFYRPLSSTNASAGEADWKAIQSWPVENSASEFARDLPLPVAGLGAVEGDRVEVALRARDTEPSRQGSWTTGTRHECLVSGPGAKLQIQYERILKVEKDLRGLVSSLGAATEAAGGWIQKFDPASGLRWDDKKNLDELAAAMKQQAGNQATMRTTASRLANDIPEDAGDLRLSVGILADTEMVRCIRILESVADRDTPQNKRMTLADARLTIDRSVRTLAEVLDKFVVYRKDWELAHMVPFTKMLAERQGQMAETSATYAGMAAEVVGDLQRKSSSRRQGRLVELAGLASVAFAGMGTEEARVGQIMIDAFKRASDTLKAEPVAGKMKQAAGQSEAGQWRAAETSQRQAGDALANLHRELRQAQASAAQQAFSNLQQIAKSSVEAQREIEKLKEGSATNMLIVNEATLNLEEIIHLRKMAEEDAKKKNDKAKDGTFDYMFEESMKGMLASPSPKTQEFDVLKLAKKPTGQSSFPNSDNREGNQVRAQIQEKFEDLVGDLLEEADDLRDDYETYNLNTAWGLNEPGEIGKQAGDMNSTAAAAATGNMKPPTQDFGGASRSGRQGARAHGMVVGDESVNRRGRDEVQEGQDEVPDQPGEMKEILSEDPQKDTSTGVGGKRIKDPNSTFSTKESGEWKDDMADKMGPPQARNAIVERKGKPISAAAAERMRDLEGKQEQVIERIKALKKELDRLYLPTDHLDEMMNKLTANLGRLKEKPDADAIRQQMETLDQLKGSVVVFNRPYADFEQSLQRQQTVKGRVLDEPPVPAIPAYEDAVNLYYEKLSGL